jgi:hypothetical protein
MKLGCFLQILRNTIALLETNSRIALSISIALICSETLRGCSSLQISRNTSALLQTKCIIILSVRVCLICTRIENRHDECPTN